MLNEINKQILTNMKTGGDKFKTGVLKLVKSELLNNQKIENPREDIQVVKNYLKKLKKALAPYAGTDRLAPLQKEIEIIEVLLPEGPSLELVIAAIDTVIQNIITGEGSIDPLKHRGRIIGSTKKAIPDADGLLISELVAKRLEEV